MRKYIKSVQPYLIMSITADGLTTAASAFLVYIQKMLFDSISLGEHINLWTYMFALLISIVTIILFSYITMILMIKSRVKVGKEMREDFFSTITEYNNEKFKSKLIGEYISVQGNDIKTLVNSYLNSLVDLVKSIIMFIIYGVIMFVFVNWKIAIIILLLSLFSVLIVPKLTQDKLAKGNKNFLDDTGKYNSKTMDLLYGFKLINSNTRDRFNEIFNNYIKVNARAEFIYKRVVAVANVMSSMSIYIINGVAVVASAVMLHSGEITIGTAVASIGFINLFAEAIEIFIYAVNACKSSDGIKNKVMEMLRSESSELIEKNSFDKIIEFKDVSIRYDEFSLEKLSYNFSKGKKYAIVGGSGSGKSSIIKALVKEIQINEGTICIDGTDIREVDMSLMISYICQDEHIFSDNFYNNVTCFSSYCDKRLASITSSLKKDSFEMIKNNPDSTKLSGGQKGCIKFLRSYLDNKEICIFDEVFAGVDNETMGRFKKHIFKTDKTVIMVTHKLSEELNDFDGVLVLDKGKIVN